MMKPENGGQAASQTRLLGMGHVDVVARRAMLGPVLLGLIFSVAALLMGPWPLAHRLVLVSCVVAGGGFVVAEYVVPWERLSPAAYLPMPALGLLDIGAGLWASGGWTSPFIAFLALPAAYAVAATNTVSALPVAVLAGLVAASPGLYTPHTSFVLTALGAVPAYCTLVLMIGAIMNHLRRSDLAVRAEHRAWQESEARARDLLALQRISVIVASHLTMDEALSAIVRTLSDAFGHSLISVYLWQGRNLAIQSQVGYSEYYETIGVGEGVIGAAFEQGKTVFLRDVRSGGLYREAADSVVSEIAVPLRDEDAVIGVLNVESREPLGDRDRDLIELFSAQVSVVLRNARLAGELRLRAERDSLTGLLNHRALVDSLDKALRVTEGTCALLVIDLDGFKAVNDSHGHLAGDELLRHVAGILLKNCREGDICARYGGDEFVVILPLTGASEAAAVAGRIVSGVRSHPHHVSDAVILVPSLSIGVAVAPEHGTGRKELLQHADEAMYRAKREHMRRDRDAWEPREERAL